MSGQHRGSPHPDAPGYPANLESGLTGLFVPATGAQYAAGALFSGEYKALEEDMVSNCIARADFTAAERQAGNPGQR